MLEQIQAWDINVLTGIREAFVTPLLDKLMIGVSALGDAGFLWICIGLVLLLMGNKSRPWRQWGWRMLFSLGATALVCNLALKPLVARIRPYDLLGLQIMVPPLGDFSFPSGHTAASFAAATAIYSMNKKWGIAAYIFGGLMGFSRLYLGVHFPTDVLAGAVIGFLMARLVLCGINKFRAQRKKRSE